MSLLNTIFSFITQKVTALATASDKTPLWLLLLLLFIVIYFIVIWFSDISKSTAIFIAFIPVLILDLIFSFGSYVFHLPFNFNYPIKHFVITAQTLDFIFNFGIFKGVGLQTFNTVSGTYALSGIQNFVVYLFTFSDVIILGISLLFILYYIGDNFSNALTGTGIITLIYVYFTNPFDESKTAVATTQHIFYFMEHASPEQQITVLGSAFISFVAIVFLISIVSSFFITVGKTTVRPGLEASSWQFNMTGIAFGLSVIYSITSVLHPEYSWYVVLPLLIGCSIVRSSMHSYAEDRRDRRQERENIREAVTSVIDNRGKFF